MAGYQDAFRRILDEEVGDYAARALELLAAAIQAKGLVLTQNLLQSQVVAASTEQMASMGVLFHQYSRIKNMKGIARTKGPARQGDWELRKKDGTETRKIRPS